MLAAAANDAKHVKIAFLSAPVAEDSDALGAVAAGASAPDDDGAPGPGPTELSAGR